MNLKIAIITAGYSQVDLAEKLGIRDTKLSRIVNGRETADPKLRAKIVSILRQRKVQVEESELFTK